MHATLRLNELPTANSRCALARPAPPLSFKDADFDEIVDPWKRNAHLPWSFCAALAADARRL
jgi:hypothetical protein